MQEYISYLTQPITEFSILRKEIAGKYRTTKGHLYDYSHRIETLETDKYHEVPYWIRTTVKHNGVLTK